MFGRKVFRHWGLAYNGGGVFSECSFLYLTIMKELLLLLLIAAWFILTVPKKTIVVTETLHPLELPEEEEFIELDSTYFIK